MNLRECNDCGDYVDMGEDVDGFALCGACIAARGAVRSTGAGGEHVARERGLVRGLADAAHELRGRR